MCVSVAFDPNVYRIVFSGGHGVGVVTDFAIFAWLTELAAVGLLAGWAISEMAKIGWIKTRWNAIEFGWLNGAVAAVGKGRSFILAYVVTKNSFEGATIAYEGIVQQLALDDDQVITMLVLGQVDRFLVRITPNGVLRIDDAGSHPPIAQMQLHLAEIANVALEVLEDPAATPSSSAE